MTLVATAAARALPDAPAAMVEQFKARKPAPIKRQLPKVTVTTPGRTAQAPGYSASVKTGALLAAAGTRALNRTTSPKQQANSAPTLPGAPADVAESQKGGFIPALTSSPLMIAAVLAAAWFIFGRR